VHRLVRRHGHGAGLRGPGRSRRLAENVFRKGGRQILSACSPIPDETPVENVRAMFAAARRYGA
jgi:hypothetical protein